MNSPILRMMTRIILPLLLMFSIIVLLRGHNEPGGGFIGGLIAAAGLALHAMAFGPSETRRIIRVELLLLLAFGLLCAMLSGFIAFAHGEPFLQAHWYELNLTLLGPVKVGTVLLFDVGVYLVVISITMIMILTMAEA